MIKEEKIGYREATILLVIMMTGKIFLSFPRNMALHGDAAGWIIVLLAGILALVSFYFINAIIKAFPDDNLLQICNKVTGKIMGLILGIIVFLFFLVITALYLRQFAESFILAVLPRTPISIITSVFLLLLIYGTMLGIETVSRVAWFYGPYLMATLLIILAFSLPKASFQQLTPVLGPGPMDILGQSLIRAPIFSEIILLAVIAPIIRQKGKVFKIGFISLISAIAINTFITALLVMIFNYAAAQRLIFPVLQISRLISFGEFLQRVEAVFVFLWFFWAGIQLSGLFYGTVVSFAQTFRIKDYRPLIFALAVLTFTLSLIPSSMTQAVEISELTLTKPIGAMAMAVTFGLPVLLWVIIMIRSLWGGMKSR